MDKILRKILLALASVFLIWQTYETLKRGDEFELESWGVILFMAWLISLYITGIFAFWVSLFLPKN
jgi:hypothetical protein